MPVKSSIASHEIEVVSEFDLTVPVNYNHDTCLASFEEKVTTKNRDRVDYKYEFQDKHWSGVTTKLIPGKKYTVRICSSLPKEKGFCVKDYTNFIRRKRGLLVGAQGLVLAFNLHKKKFPDNTTVISLDKENALSCYTDQFSEPTVPYVHRCGDKWRISVAGFYTCLRNINHIGVDLSIEHFLYFVEKK